MGGRPKGAKSKVTLQVKEVFATALQAVAPLLEEKLREVLDGPDPAKGIELMLKLADKFIPSLARTEVTGENGGAITLEMLVPKRKLLPPAPEGDKS